MRPVRAFAVWAALAIVPLCGCKKSTVPPLDLWPRDSGSMTPDAGPDGGGGLAACLDRPTDLARPPTGQLPCELIPPGLQLP